MVDIFEIKMCNYCKNTYCEKNILISDNKGVTSYKCKEYIRDDKKIAPYKKPELVTAKKEHFKLI